jgi:hypothetical protein
MMRLFNRSLLPMSLKSTYSVNVLSQLAFRESSKEGARHSSSQSDYESSDSMRHGLFGSERSSAVSKNCIAGVEGGRGVGERTVSEQ